MSITVKPSQGREGFYAAATLDSLSLLSSRDILREENGIVALDMNPAQFRRRLKQPHIRINPAERCLTTLRTQAAAH